MEARKLKLNDPLFFEAFGFLQDEAELLDNNQFQEWLSYLSDDLIYTMPTRTTHERTAGSGYSQNMFHFEDNYNTINMRVKRLQTEHAWAEDPPSRTRRFVTNVRVTQEDENKLKIKSYLLLLRNRMNDPNYQILSAERCDCLVRSDSGLKLSKREILVDQSTIGMDNLALFL